jgi:hypothetical protein
LVRLFSMVTLLADQYMANGADVLRRTTWYDKRHPTFSDAPMLVRKELWTREQLTFCGSVREVETAIVPRELVVRLTDAVRYPA